MTWVKNIKYRIVRERRPNNFLPKENKEKQRDEFQRH